MKKFPPPVPKPRTLHQDSHGKEVLKPQQRWSYTSPPTSPSDSPEKEVLKPQQRWSYTSPPTSPSDSPEKEVLKPQQRWSYTSPPTSPLDSPEKEGGEMTELSDRPLTVAEKVRRLESFSIPGGSDRIGGSDPPGGSDTPRGFDPPGGSDTPRGFDPPGGSDTPRGSDPPGGSDTPRGSDIPGGSDTPRGFDPPGGSDTPRGFDPPGGSDTQDSSKGISERLMLVKVGEGDCKGPAFTQDHTYECVIADNKRVIVHQTSYEAPRQFPPPLPFRQTSVSTWREDKRLQRQDNIKDDPEFLMEWWKTVISWEDLENQPLEHGEAALYSVKAQRIYHTLLLYEQLLNKNGESMNNNITELFSIADNLDKVSKGTKIAGITGGATSAVGGIAAVAGVVLSPFTLGASLALTVIGVGVATAGGVTGASAAIAHKVSVTQDRKKIETVLQAHRAHVDDLEACLTFINRGMGSLRMHNLAVLTGVHTKAVRVAKVVEVAGDSAKAMEASSKASGVLNGFALAMDLFYSGKDRQKLKKGLESKFAKQIRQVAGQLQDGLKELVKVKDMYKELVKE